MNDEHDAKHQILRRVADGTLSPSEAAEHAKLRDAELELARREKYFRALTENSLDILAIFSRDGILKNLT